MDRDRPRRLRMIAGPNGSGKSSIIRNLAKERSSDGVFWLNHSFNADDVVSEWGRVYDISILAGQRLC